MSLTKFKSIVVLEENSTEVCMEATEILIRITRNILSEPSNPKFRSISLGSSVVTDKLLPASGALECLFEMGFQKGEDKLILPQDASLSLVKSVHDELLKKREQHLALNKSVQPVQPVTNLKKIEDSTIPLIKKDLMTLCYQKNPFFSKIIYWCFYVLRYENYELQMKALKLIPLIELNLNVLKKIRKIQLEFKQKKLKEEDVDYQQLLLIELCNWFNTEFFTWVDTPQCTKCGFSETVHLMTSEKIPGADRVENYKCPKCEEHVLFFRYSDPQKLLETRRGRCGEWANCFCLFARALGWDTRLVVDETDHVWVEVFSILNSKWMHCDPCENVVGTPLMYECGWKKKLSYIMAYSKDEIQDVTWRYSCKHKEVLRNRKKCLEKDLVGFIIKIRNVMLARASEARRNYVIKRTVLELVELMKTNPPNETEEKGRISGSLGWRLMRGETNEPDFEPYIWKIDEEDENRRKFILSYITSKDEYFRNSKSVMKSWRNGLFSVKSVFKKNEKDWKMTYLSRTEGEDKGIVSWKFDTGEKFNIGSIELKLVHKTFETGMIICKLCSNDSCVRVPNDKETFLTDAFMGLKTVEVIVEMFGGSGPNAWQHAQILRQHFSSEEITFSIVINLVQV